MGGRTLRCLVAVVMASAAPVEAARADDVDALQEKAMRAAVLQVAPSVVQIETTGGMSLLEFGPLGATLRKGLGPTTGLIVSPDGYIMSSAFNFASKPTAIFVAVRGRKDRFVAKVVATDHTRMVTLLKIDAAGLPVPTAAPKKSFQVGEWSLALGRTWSQNLDDPPSVSVGIISALDRIWGKAVQTDAKVSPVNYGGPLVDVEGRVMGVLVPASPRADNENAGVEWYDSGIGFAIPLEDINAVLPRLKAGHDLRRGLLGVLLRGRDTYGEPAVVDNVTPESPAAQAGMQAGDTIIDIDGHQITRQAQMMHALGAKYEGDLVSVKVRRGGKVLSFANLKLIGELAGFADPFLGIVPVRDDPDLGVDIRYVWPKSPAEGAGLKPGDRILSLGPPNTTPKPFSGRDELLAMLNAFAPGREVKIEVRRKATPEKVEPLTLKLGPLPDSVPATLPEPASGKKALAPRKAAPGPRRPGPGTTPPKAAAKKPETGFLRRSNATHDHEYWLYVPEDYDPNISYAVFCLKKKTRRGLSKQGFEKSENDFADKWADYCADHHIIMLGPRADNDTGWLLSETESIQEAIREVLAQYTIDRQRIVAHGMGQGGQMAMYVGLNARDLIRGVAVSGASLATAVKDNVPSQRLAFFLVTGGKDPAAAGVADTRKKLVEKKFPVVYRDFPNRGSEYLAEEETELPELVRWIDSLDRL